MHHPPIGTAYSATVRLELHVANQIFELAEIGPESVFLRKPVTLPPCEAEVIMYIDGRRRVWQVDLPDGLFADSPRARHTLRMLPHEEEVLRALYRDINIPTDRYSQLPEKLGDLVNGWNQRTGRNESATDVLHYMITRRKQGKWETLDQCADEVCSHPRLQFSDDELAHLDAIHQELQIATDGFALGADFSIKLQREFARRTGRIIPSMILATKLISRFKGGHLRPLKPKDRNGNPGFGDVCEEAG